MDKEQINSRFLTAVEEILTAKKINKSALANKLSISSNKFSEILSKRMKAGIDTIALLCYHYNISTRWVLLGEGEMWNTPECEQTEKDPLSLVDKLIEQAEEIGKLRQQLEAIKRGE